MVDKREVMTFRYVNWEGKERDVRIIPVALTWLDEPGYGYKAGWFIIGHDLDRNMEERHFRFDGRISFPEKVETRVPVRV
jgi:hypothetical protein